MVTGRRVQVTLRRSESPDSLHQAPPVPQPLPALRGQGRPLPALDALITSDAGPYAGLSGGVLEQGCIFLPWDPIV